MSKKEKIAESIIIRVGGGIREVRREHVEGAAHLESVRREPDFEQTEDGHPFSTELGPNIKINSDKIIN